MNRQRVNNSLTWGRHLIKSHDFTNEELLVAMAAVNLGASTAGVVRLCDRPLVEHLHLESADVPFMVFGRLEALGWAESMSRDVSGRLNFRLTIPEPAAMRNEGNLDDRSPAA